MNEHPNHQGNFPREEQFVLMSKEINKYLLRFHDKDLEREYFLHSLYKYKELGYTICVIHVIIIIADFVDLFESTVFPQKKLIHLVSMLAAAIIIFIFLHFKESWFNVAYSVYYCVYITLNGWYMYDSDLNQEELNNGSGNAFTRGYTISAILILGITGSNYILKNILFLYGTILIFIAQGIQQGAEFEIIIKAILTLSLYLYVSHHREYAHRRSYLRQKQIDQYNNIMNNQIPHCLFAAKFNSAEQRIELFKCNSRAQKEFGINGNEDFDHFITNMFMVSSCDELEPKNEQQQQQEQQQVDSLNNNNSSQQNQPLSSAGEQTWENSLKGQIRHLIDQRVHQSHDISESPNSSKPKPKNKANTSNLSNQNIRSPIFKLKLLMQEGKDTENKISVQLSLFKLHEYYIIITVDKWKKQHKKSRKHKLDNNHGKIINDQKIKENENTKRDSYGNKNNQNIDNYCNIQNRNKHLSDINQQFQQQQQQQQQQQEQVDDIENRQLNNNIINTCNQQNSTPSPPLNILPDQGILNDEEEQQDLINENQNSGIQRTHATTTFHARTSIMGGGYDTPRLRSSLTQAKISSQASIPIATPSTAVSHPSQSSFKTKQQQYHYQFPSQSNNTQFSYLLQNKLSLSGTRRPAGSIYSLGSTNILHENTNKPRTTSIGFENTPRSPHILQHLLLHRQRNSLLSIPNNQQNQPSNQKIATSSNSISKDSMITAACFETIQQTIKLVKRYKDNQHSFRDGLVNKNLLTKGVDPIVQYTASMMQEILIVNSNFIRLNVLQHNGLQLQCSTFKLTSLCQYLQQHLQPLLLDKNISLYLQDEKELDGFQIFSDEFALRISLVNIISYIATKIPQNSFVSLKFSFDQNFIENNSSSDQLQIQISSTFYEDSAFSDIDSLLCLDMDNQKTNQRFNVDLKVALNLLKIINNNNPKTKEYLRFSVPNNKQQHMHLSIFIPRFDYCEEKQQTYKEISNTQEKQTEQIKSTILIKDETDGLNSIKNSITNENINTDAKILLTSEGNYQTDGDFPDFDNNNNPTDCSFSSLDKWIAFKQLTSRITEEPIKLIL